MTAPDPLAEAALKTWGATKQLTQAAEEGTEFALACLHYIRGKATPDELATEIADMEQMLAQVRIMLKAADPAALARARRRQRGKLRAALAAAKSRTRVVDALEGES